MGRGEDLNQSLVLENDRAYVPHPWGLNSLNRSKGATLLIVAKNSSWFYIFGDLISRKKSHSFLIVDSLFQHDEFNE